MKILLQVVLEILLMFLKVTSQMSLCKRLNLKVLTSKKFLFNPDAPTLVILLLIFQTCDALNKQSVPVDFIFFNWLFSMFWAVVPKAIQHGVVNSLPPKEKQQLNETFWRCEMFTAIMFFLIYIVGEFFDPKQIFFSNVLVIVLSFFLGVIAFGETQKRLPRRGISNLKLLFIGVFVAMLSSKCYVFLSLTFWPSVYSLCSIIVLNMYLINTEAILHFFSQMLEL